MNLPMHGERRLLAFQREVNQKLHDMGATVVGHFRFANVLGDWDKRDGFVDWYDNRWPNDLLGDKPHPDVIELLKRDSTGRPIVTDRYLHLCPSSPHARQMLKQMLTLAIDHGVDGLITNYNYHYGCACPYCQASFKAWLSRHMTPQQIQQRLGIASLADHTFETIPARITGYPRTDESDRVDWLTSSSPRPPADLNPATELEWFAMAWAAENFKLAWDDVMITHGRSVKPDLILATWNHLSNVSRGEERAFLPIDLWGRGEDYFWYSGGASFVDRGQNLSEGRAGDAWLAHLYIRALGEGKQFVMGKYERTRLAMSMAEGYATGSLGMGRYMNFQDPVGFDVLVQATRFRNANRQLWQAAQPVSDAALLLPRESVQHRRPDALDAFRDLGQALVEKQVLIDVIVDQRLGRSLGGKSVDPLAKYPVVILPRALVLSDQQIAHLSSYVGNGGKLLAWGPAGVLKPSAIPGDSAQPRAISARSGPVGVPGATPIQAEDARAAADAIVAELGQAGAADITAPFTVRATLYRQPNRLVLHLVNYDREPGAREDNRGGPPDERPQAVENIAVSLPLPQGIAPTAVTLLAPDRDQPLKLDFQVNQGRITFTVPRLLVYGIAVIDF
jgi:hypothetical protein